METLNPPIEITNVTKSGDTIYSVSQLNANARMILENTLKTVWITGEISNLARPSSGHWYFSLKDERAQVRCAFFRQQQRRLTFQPNNGMQVLVQAQVSIYEARGDYQLIVTQVEPAGFGALQLAFDQLKQRLQKEGLFDSIHKKPIPLMPKTVGIITSASAAALRDVLKVLRQRFPSINLIIYPTTVQGDKAAAQITAAIETANRRHECEVLILTRGGGSLEDLWPFNEEIVARAIFNSKLPIVTGIGHEIDFTIADFVADYRAPTPSAAAEKVSPDKTEFLQKIKSYHQRLQHIINSQLLQISQYLSHLKNRLQHPGKKLQDQAQRLDLLEQQLLSSLQHQLQLKQLALKQIETKLLGFHLAKQISHHQTELQTLKHRMITAVDHHLKNQIQQLTHLSRALQAVSPLATLDRGYAIVLDPKTKHIIHHANTLKTGDRIQAQLAKGQLECIVDIVHDL